MNLSQEEWKSRAGEAENAVIIDVRTPEEWQEGIVAGARMLNIFDASKFMEEVNAMDRQAEYFLYCRSGARSGQACQILNSQGIEKAFNLEGGMLAWEGELSQPE